MRLTGRPRQTLALNDTPRTDHRPNLTPCSGTSETGLSIGAQGGFDGGRGADVTCDGVESLEPVTGVEHDRVRVRIEHPGPEQLAQGGHGHPTRRLPENALGAGQQPHALNDLVVGDVLHRTAGASADVENIRTVSRVPDGQ